MVNLSFGAKFFGGYRRDSKGIRDYENEARQNLIAQQLNLIGVEFTCGDYRDMVIPKNSVVYCDPPYKGTTGYKDRFDHDSFYKWCEVKAGEGHVIFLSEYSAPEMFECVFEKEVSSNLTVGTKGKKETEKLYRLRT